MFGPHKMSCVNAHGQEGEERRRVREFSKWHTAAEAVACKEQTYRTNRRRNFNHGIQESQSR